MTPLDAALLVSGFLLLLVTLAGAIRLAERVVPGLTEWLDRHWSTPTPWERER